MVEADKVVSMVRFNADQGQLRAIPSGVKGSPGSLNGFSDILPWRIPPQSFQIVESPVFR